MDYISKLYFLQEYMTLKCENPNIGVQKCPKGCGEYPKNT